MDINVTLIIIGVIALIALVAHGLWSNRKEKMQIFENEGTFTENKQLNATLQPMTLSKEQNVPEPVLYQPQPVPNNDYSQYNATETYMPTTSEIETGTVTPVMENYYTESEIITASSVMEETQYYSEMPYAPQSVAVEETQDLSLDQIKISLPNSESQHEYYEDRVKGKPDYTMQTQLRSRDLDQPILKNPNLIHQETVENYYPEPDFSSKKVQVDSYPDTDEKKEVQPAVPVFYPEPNEIVAPVMPQISVSPISKSLAETELTKVEVENYYPELGDNSEIREYYPDLQSRKVKQAGARAVRAKSEPVVAKAEKQEKDPNLAIVYVMAAQDDEFTGLVLAKIFKELGFAYGERELYHRYADLDPTKPSLFSVVNLTTGVFNPNQMEYFSTKGIALVMDIDESQNRLRDFYVMLRTAKELANKLNGHLLDDKQCPFGQLSEAEYTKRCK